MKADPTSTHRPNAVPPAQFRDQATGIGECREASLQTGAARAQRVVATMPAKAKAALPVESGYPTR